MICRNVKMLAAATVAVVMLAAGAWAQESWTSGSTTVTLNNGTLTVSGTGAMANYTSTNAPWAAYRNLITGAVIEEGVTNIGNYAFYGCTGLTSVTIPDGVTSIGTDVFSGCTGLTSVTIPSSVISIGAGVFYNCTGLTSVTIPDGVTSIGAGVFSGCTGLTDIEVGNSNSAYSSVAGVLFDKDKSTLVAYPGGKQGTTYSIPNSVTSIGYSAFELCRGLTSVTIPSGVTSISNSAFRFCAGLTSVTIPDGVTSIGTYAFQNCTGLTSVTIPDGVTSIGTYVFSGCTGLTSVTIPDGVTSIGTYMFSGCTGLTSVAIPSSVTSIGNNAFYQCTGLTSVTIPNSVTSIGGTAFYGCRGLTSVTIPNSVTSIGTYAFYGCTGLTSVTSLAVVPPTLGSDAFFNVLAVLHVPEGSAAAYMAADQWKSLGIIDGSGSPLVWECGASPNVAAVTATLNTADGTFTISGTGAMANYTSSNAPWAAFRSLITGATIEEGVTNIGNYAFYNCTGLTSVTIPNSVTSIGTYVFSGCTGLASVTIGSGVTSIGNYAFQGCAGLTSVTIPSNVTSIGTYVFYNCTGLTSVTIGSGVTSIGNYAFRGCTSLTSIETGDGNSAYSSVAGVLFNKDKSTLVAYPVGKQGAYSIPTDVTSIGLAAFYGCAGLTSVTIPNSVTNIVASAFNGCTGLTSVTIPSSVTSIGNSAFSGCTGLTSVTSLIDVPLTINSNVFNNVPVASATLYVPEANVEAYSAATVWMSFGTIWDTTTVTVSFNSQSGSAVASQNIRYKGKVTEPADPTLKGSNFDGWFKEADCINQWDFGVDVVTSAVTLYAKWTTIEIHVVTFNSEGGSVEGTEHIEHGGKVTEPADPIRAGHTFGGWYKEAEYTNLWDFDTDVVTSAVTLYAKWTINTYAVTFSAGANGSLAATVDESAIVTGALVEYGKSVVFTATPNEDYEVSGWTVDGVAVADNVANTYTLTSVSEETTVAVSFAKTVSVLTPDRVIPQAKPKEEATVIAPVSQLTGEFTAGPNPVSKQSGIVNFYRQGKRVSNSELRIYDATGNVINKVKISDKALNSQARRQVRSWDLKDKNGRTVSEGTYLVKGVVKTLDGKSEKVSVIVGVR